MPIDPEGFRDAARMFATGLTVVTVNLDGDLHGMTASSFASISLDPPLVMVSLDKGSRTREMVSASGTFAVNILGEEQEAIAKSFSVSGRKDFSTIPHTIDISGAPLFDDALARLTCRTYATHDGGDHDILLAEVLDASVSPGRPLLYFDRSYRRML
ncbi:MAG: flavin reductase family protein [Actinomycetota bacterium]